MALDKMALKGEECDLGMPAGCLRPPDSTHELIYHCSRAADQAYKVSKLVFEFPRNQWFTDKL